MQTYKRLRIGNEACYGLHMLYSATNCNDNLRSVDYWKEFLPKLVHFIDMTTFGEPVVARFGEGEEVGISGVQLMLTSSITVHTNDKFGDLYLDVFSCKEFNPSQVEEFIQHAFEPEGVNWQVVVRK